MRILEFISENPISRFTKEQVKKHPYLTTAVLSGLVLVGTMYDTVVNVSPIMETAHQEAYKICNYPSQEELTFAKTIASSSSPIDRQRANQIEARVQGCATTATVMENRALSDSGRGGYIFELLASAGSGAILFSTGLLKLTNRRRATQTAIS